MNNYSKVTGYIVKNIKPVTYKLNKSKTKTHFHENSYPITRTAWSW